MRFSLNSKGAKIIVDILMTIFLALSFVRWEGDPTFHFVVGAGCTLFFALHICIHRKWIKSVTKSCVAGKLNKSLKWKYIVDILLLVVWGASIITGLLAIGHYVGGAESMSGFGRLHGVTARVGLALVVIHVYQHRGQIGAYLGIRKIKPSQSAQ